MATEAALTTVYLGLLSMSLFEIGLTMAGDSRCVKDLKLCPPGHYMKGCTTEDGDGGMCLQCPSGTFQPDENRYPDNCRLTRLCDKPNMEYQDFGTTIRDAECRCVDTHHFEGDDQRACVPNHICEKGYGQGPYGECVPCKTKNMYSDKRDNRQRCMPLTRCEHYKRCTVKRSNGTSDNECGMAVDDISKCKSLLGGSSLSAGATAGIVIGSLLAVGIIAFLCILLVRRRRRHPRPADSEAPREAVDAATTKIIEFSKKDEDFCRKVSQLCDRRVEKLVARQNWALAQDLFRSHPQPGKYEILVQKYKDAALAEQVAGYLKEWHDWRGSGPDSIAFLFASLRRVSREDIVVDICRRVHTEAGDIGIHIPSSHSNAHDNRAYYFKSILPCTKRKPKLTQEPKNVKNNEQQRNVKPLLSEGRANNEEEEPGDVNVLHRTQPSAPMMVSEVGFDRQESVPIQASS